MSRPSADAAIAGPSAVPAMLPWPVRGPVDRVTDQSATMASMPMMGMVVHVLSKTRTSISVSKTAMLLPLDDDEDEDVDDDEDDGAEEPGIGGTVPRNVWLRSSQLPGRIVWRSWRPADARCSASLASARPASHSACCCARPRAMLFTLSSNSFCSSVRWDSSVRAPKYAFS